MYRRWSVSSPVPRRRRAAHGPRRCDRPGWFGTAEGKLAAMEGRRHHCEVAGRPGCGDREASGEATRAGSRKAASGGLFVAGTALVLGARVDFLGRPPRVPGSRWRALRAAHPRFGELPGARLYAVLRRSDSAVCAHASDRGTAAYTDAPTTSFQLTCKAGWGRVKPTMQSYRSTRVHCECWTREGTQRACLAPRMFALRGFGSWSAAPGVGDAAPVPSVVRRRSLPTAACSVAGSTRFAAGRRRAGYLRFRGFRGLRFWRPRGCRSIAYLGERKLGGRASAPALLRASALTNPSPRAGAGASSRAGGASAIAGACCPSPLAGAAGIWACSLPPSPEIAYFVLTDHAPTICGRRWR